MGPDFGSITEAIQDPKGRLAKLLKSDKTRDEIVEELYQLTIVRSPTPQEKKRIDEYLDKQESPETAMADLMYALTATGEFWFIP
jgi:hypothetical protein